MGCSSYATPNGETMPDCVPTSFATSSTRVRPSAAGSCAWSGRLVRFPERDDLRALRTFRNRDLITRTEQAILYSATIAVFGLSVGSSVVERLVGSGIGRSSSWPTWTSSSRPTSTGSTAPSATSVSTRQTRRQAGISSIDPYINQVHLRSGIDQDVLEAIIRTHSRDILIDEMDDLAMKARVRQATRDHRIPVLSASDVGDRTVIDVGKGVRAAVPGPSTGGSAESSTHSSTANSPMPRGGNS